MKTVGVVLATLDMACTIMGVSATKIVPHVTISVKIVSIGGIMEWIPLDMRLDSVGPRWRRQRDI